MIEGCDLLTGNEARSEVLPLAITCIAHLCCQFWHVFALLISMPRFKSVNFYQNRSKIKLLLQKNLQIPSEHVPTIAGFGYVPGYSSNNKYKTVEA